MKVKTLIAELQKLNPEETITIFDGEVYFDIDEIENATAHEPACIWRGDEHEVDYDN